MRVIEIVETLKSFYFSKNIYLFGSILKSKKNFYDIDILILYECKEELHQKKSDLEKLSIYYPLDIYYLTFEEEKELNFIDSVMAIPIKSIYMRNNNNIQIMY